MNRVSKSGGKKSPLGVRVERSGGKSGRSKGKSGYKSILVPVDFSKTSLYALEYAIGLAQEFGAKLHLIHVLEFPAVFNNSSQPSYAAWDRDLKTNAAERLAALVESKGAKSVAATFEVRIGRAYKSICNVAKQRNADVILIGTNGFTGLKHLVLGSTAERVVRYARCPVLIVRKGLAARSRPAFKPTHLLVPTDFSSPAEKALQHALRLATQYRASLHLLYVVQAHYAVGEYDAPDYALLAAEQKEIGQLKLNELSREIGVTNTTQVRFGRPAVEINEAAAEQNCDLVVIATHGFTGWKRMALGSTTEEVVRHAHCPVLVVK